MTSILIWKLIKWMALAMWIAGAFKVVDHPSQKHRLQGLYGLLIWGFAGTWLSGWGLMKSLAFTMKEPWISWSMLWGLISLSASFGLAFQSMEGWFAKLSRIAVLGGLLSAMGIMVFKDQPSHWSLVMTGSVIVGAVWSHFANSFESETNADQERSLLIQKGFRHIAWVEGLTVILLFGLYMPLKYAAGINIDGGTGLLGWAHGVFVIVYMITLLFTGKALSWSFLRIVLGGLASFLPFGTVIFERRVLQTHSSSAPTKR